MSKPLTPTPEIDAWCELAMHADVSAALNLAKGFERRLHAKESELEAAQKMVEELRKDKERMDWLENPETCYHVCIDRQPDGFSIINARPNKGEVRQAIDAAVEQMNGIKES